MRKGKFLSTRELVLCALFSALTAVGAYIRIPLPMLTLTLQFFFTNLAALLLGRKLGAFAAAGYVLAGLTRLPIFARVKPLRTKGVSSCSGTETGAFKGR